MNCKTLVLLLVLFSAVGCKKYKFKDGERYLPRHTQNGRGIFACYINGNTYKSRRQPKATYNKSTGYLYIQSKTKSFEFRLFVYEGLFETGDYQFSMTGEELIDFPGNGLFGAKVNGINELEIVKINIDEGIVSGKFNLDLYNEDNTRNIEVREGRFDLEIQIID